MSGGPSCSSSRRPSVRFTTLATSPAAQRAVFVAQSHISWLLCMSCVSWRHVCTDVARSVRPLTAPWSRGRPALLWRRGPASSWRCRGRAGAAKDADPDEPLSAHVMRAECSTPITTRRRTQAAADTAHVHAVCDCSWPQM